MKNLLKIIILIIVIILLVPFLYQLFKPTGWIVTKKSESYLNENRDILKVLKAEKDCSYEKPATFPDRRFPLISCFSNDLYKIDNIVAEIDSIENYLKRNGWTGGGSPALRMYSKGDLEISVEPYQGQSRPIEEIKNQLDRLLIQLKHKIW